MIALESVAILFKSLLDYQAKHFIKETHHSAQEYDHSWVPVHELFESLPMDTKSDK